MAFSALTVEGGSLTNKSAKKQSRQEKARMAAGIHEFERCWVKAKPAPQPNPEPQRLQAWEYPPTRPFISWGVSCAARPLVAIPRKETAMFARITIRVRSGRLDSLTGSKPVTIIPADVTIPEMMYHFFRDKVVSTKGAHKNLKTWGSRLAATKAETASTETPAFVKSHA